MPHQNFPKLANQSGLTKKYIQNLLTIKYICQLYSKWCSLWKVDGYGQLKDDQYAIHCCVTTFTLQLSGCWDLKKSTKKKKSIVYIERMPQILDLMLCHNKISKASRRGEDEVDEEQPTITSNDNKTIIISINGLLHHFFVDIGFASSQVW